MPRGIKDGEYSRMFVTEAINEFLRVSGLSPAAMMSTALAEFSGVMIGACRLKAVAISDTFRIRERMTEEQISRIIAVLLVSAAFLGVVLAMHPQTRGNGIGYVTRTGIIG
jgi:hypothetical protein